MSTEGTICGSGNACEQVCPIVRIGQRCPGVQQYFAEALAAGIDPWPVLTAERAPQPA